MNKNIVNLGGLFLGLTSALSAQNAFWDGPDAYLRQKPPGDTPIEFAPGLLADPGNFAIGRIGISPDGKEICYTQNNTWFDDKDELIKGFKFADGKWSGPVVLFHRLANPAYSSDGNTLYLGGSMTQVLRVARTRGGWGAPEKFLDNQHVEVYNFNPTAGAHFYACSNPDSEDTKSGSTDVFSVLTVSNGVPTIKSLGRPLNSPGFNGDFFVSPDESYMLLSAKETKDYECEIYISFRKADKTWTNPKSLGSAINNGVAHRFGEFVTPDNKYLFYTKGTAPKDTKIFWVRFDQMIERLRNSNFDPYVKKPIADMASIVGQRISLKIDDRTFMDDDGNDTLSISASQENGRVLPTWLSFDPSTMMLSGTPLEPASYKLRITATDNAMSGASCTFSITVKSS
jgi:Putative Ig domain/WD40-like Beta Propeller Repeat